MGEVIFSEFFEPEVVTRGPYGVPIFSPDEIALMRSSLEFIRSLPPGIQVAATLSALWLASFYGLKPKKNTTPESASPQRGEPEL